MKTPAFSGRTMVMLTGGLQTYFLYIPRNGSPGNIAGILQSIAKNNVDKLFVGSVVTDFIAAIHPAVRCELLTSFDTSSREYDLEIRIAAAGHELNCAATSKKGTVTYFNGSLTKFAEWAEKAASGLAGLVKKVVKFKYAGGSKPGAKRLVRVEEVKKYDDGSWSLHGHDLEKDDLKNSCRQYNVAKILGEIEVIN